MTAGGTLMGEENFSTNGTLIARQPWGAGSNYDSKKNQQEIDSSFTQKYSQDINYKLHKS